MIDPRAVSQYGGRLAESTPCHGVLFVLVGPSAVGKNTVMKRVMAKLPELRQLPTVTTRPIRKDEQQGREHYFVSLDDFRDMSANHELIEYQEVYPGWFYGTPRKLLIEAFEAQKKMIADIEVVGASKLKEEFPDRVVLIFMAPPSLDTLEQRLRSRGNMSEDEIAKRRERASFEMSYADRCDYRVTNDRLEPTVGAVLDIITGELIRRDCSQPFSAS